MNMLKTVNREGVILCNGDIDILPLWYLQFVDGKRPEVVSFTMQLIPYDWYRNPLFSRWPFLYVPLRKNAYGQDDINPETVVQDMITQHANDRSFYFTNIFTAPWLREKNPAEPEGFLWRLTKTKGLDYAPTSARLNVLWDSYRLRYMDLPDRGYWDEYTDVMKDSYGIGYDFTGYYSLMRGMPDIALWGFEHALRYRQPQTISRIYMMIGETYLAMGDFPNAINNYLITLKVEPNNPYVYGRVGEGYFLMKNYLEAQAAFQKAVSINNQEAEAMDGLAVINNPADAASKLQEAIKKGDPKQNGFLYAELGNAYFMLKKYPEAKQAYQKSLSINQGQVEAIDGLRMLSENHS
jgi:tetratricopeptide (TPR) repeat protein